MIISELNILGSFDFGRVFLFEWTVNWRFLPEEIFVDRTFHAALLILHVMVLLICIPSWWEILSGFRTSPSSANRLILPLFMANFIGMTFARSLHYQFYIWYYHQLPFLCWWTKFPTTVKLTILGLIELCWFTFPSTVWSSAVLNTCHLALLIGLMVQKGNFQHLGKRAQRRRVAKDK